MSQQVAIAWFRQDLRVQDNPLLAEAQARGLAVLPVFIHAPGEADPWAPGAASNWWLHHALESLRQQLVQLGLPLVIRQGPSAGALISLAEELRRQGQEITAVWCSRLYEPALAARDQRVTEELAASGMELESFEGSLLLPPEEIANQSGQPFRVYTPFWKSLRTRAIAAPVSIEAPNLQAPGQHPDPGSVEDLRLLPSLDWDAEFPDHWTPSIDGAHHALNQFLHNAVTEYKSQRDVPGIEATSRLSPFLHFGQISPRQVWAAVHAQGVQETTGGFHFLSEVVWREFGYHLLHHFPHTPEQPLNERFAEFPWQRNEKNLHAWQRGQTGYPFVDAGMRQLWRSGWMHNRVRMVVASFLVKHLLQPWQDGAEWFWDTLVDADLASNTLGWQWTAGCGADAAPYFRIFNPFGQGEKFDPEGDYVRRWVPELRHMPKEFIHRPWEAPPLVLHAAGVRLGENYPEPIVDHGVARERALAALQQIKK